MAGLSHSWNDTTAYKWTQEGDVAERRPFFCLCNQLIDISNFMDPMERYLLITAPLSKYFHESMGKAPSIWAASLMSSPLDVPLRIFHQMSWEERMRLHHSLSRSLFDLTQHTENEINVENFEEVLRAPRAAIRVLGDVLTNDARREEIQCSDIPEYILKMMACYLSDEALMIEALFVLMLLFRLDGLSEAEGVALQETSDWRHTAAVPSYQFPVSVVPSVLSTMRFHRARARVQEMGAWAMVNLALQTPMRDALVEEDAIITLVSNMERHIDDKGVQYRSIFALINLVNFGLWRHHRNTPPPEELEEEVVYFLPPEREMKSTMTTEDEEFAPRSPQRVIASCLASITRFMEDDLFADRGCLLLYNLTLDARNHSQLDKLDVIGLVQRAAATHPDNATIKSSLDGVMSKIGQIEVTPLAASYSDYRWQPIAPFVTDQMRNGCHPLGQQHYD